MSTFDFQFFEDNGYLIMPRIEESLVRKLAQKIDDYMIGNLRSSKFEFQLDTKASDYSDVKRDYAKDEHVSTTNYRKVKGLEYDIDFLNFFQSAPIREVSTRLIGPNCSSMRAMLFNKPAQGGAPLPFHQDLNTSWPMSKLPVLTFWYGLDGSNEENGGLQIVEGSHKFGIIGEGHLLSEENEKKFVDPAKLKLVQLEPGAGIVFHCGLLHRSGVNRSPRPRRAITLCLCEGDTLHLPTGKPYPMIFGEGALTAESIQDN